MLDELIKNIKNESEKILVIGFAETATAIGNYVASKLPNCVYQMQTTREMLEEKAMIEFKEEHSHAPTQLLYGKTEVLKKVNQVIFVEDEITTGKTIINFIEEIKKINSNIKYAVASILNWQDEETSKLYKELGIETYYFIKGKIKDINAKIDIETEQEFNSESEPKDKINCLKVKSELCNLKATRLGKTPIKDLNFYSQYIFDKVKKVSNIINQVVEEENKEILVIGTEEFMYEPLLFAGYLEKNTKNNVFYQATTRSPIEVSKENNYILHTRYRFNSCYEENRTTYLYNLKKYDYIFIITDSEPTDEFIECMSKIWAGIGCDFNKIEIISFGGQDE